MWDLIGRWGRSRSGGDGRLVGMGSKWVYVGILQNSYRLLSFITIVIAIVKLQKIYVAKPNDLLTS